MLTLVSTSRKSQIAIEYCYRFRKSHPQSSIMWIHASTVERIDQAYKEIARKAQLSGWDNPKTDKLTLVADWLSQGDSGHWLIVLDNADDADVFFNTNHDLVSKGSESKPIVRICPFPSPIKATKRSNDFTSVKSLADIYASGHVTISPLSGG